MLLIGSAAAKFNIDWFREPKDIDLVLSSDELEKFYSRNSDSIVSFKPQFHKDRFTCKMANGTMVELHVAKEGCGHHLLVKSQRHNRVVNVLNCDVLIASVKTLLMLKKSHITFPIKWQKHIRDYHTLKGISSKHSTQDQDDEVLLLAYYKILEETSKRFEKYKSSSLNMTNEEFFARSEAYVNRKYKHDDIHYLVAFYSEPMYTKLKNDQSKALCLKSKWDSLSFEDKVKSVKEEAYVIALERKIIPAYEKGESITPELKENAFSWAIERICTTLTSGWFREFAIENWPVCGPNNEDYSFVDKFLNWNRR